MVMFYSLTTDFSSYALATQFHVPDGITYKRADKKYNKGVIVKSDNMAYKSYPIKYAEIIDVWKFTCALSIVESEPDNMDNLSFKEIVTELRKRYY